MWAIHLRHRQRLLTVCCTMAATVPQIVSSVLVTVVIVGVLGNLLASALLLSKTPTAVRFPLQSVLITRAQCPSYYSSGVLSPFLHEYEPVSEKYQTE